MSRPGKYDTGRDLDATFSTVLSTVARWLFYAGTVASVVSLSFLIYYAVMPEGQAPPLRQAQGMIGTFSSVLTAGLLAATVGAAFTFWGEEVMPALLLLAAALVYFCPLIVPMATGGQTTAVGSAALAATQTGGILFGGLSMAVLIVDLAVRARERANRGTRADQLRYGKGVREELDVQNVFLGKCWQLPFCRKFVREKCPIYLSRRTCWRERVGCMCEERVIQGAMENRAIPRDAVAAAQYIPRNNSLTLAQKKERCRNCVIYNEHQKHKYKAVMPLILLAFGAGYAAFRAPLLAMTGDMIKRIDQVVMKATFRQDGGLEKAAAGGGTVFQEFLLVCFFIVAMTYVMRLAEYLIFKAKV